MGLYRLELPVAILVEADSMEEARRTIAIIFTEVHRHMPTGAAINEDLGDLLRKVERR